MGAASDCPSGEVNNSGVVTCYSATPGEERRGEERRGGGGRCVSSNDRASPRVVESGLHHCAYLFTERRCLLSLRKSVQRLLEC